VIVVLADDLGPGDLSCANPEGKIATPHLDTMAEQGVVFTDFHSTSAVCTPTRYALLTGRYNWRSRLAKGVLNGYSSHLIPPERATLGHLMRAAGYHTAMIGKWHLGWDWAKDEEGEVDFTAPVPNGPDINGFDRYYAHCGSLDMAPYVWVDTGKVTAQPDRVIGVTKKEDPYGWYRKGPTGSDFDHEQVLPHLFEKTIAHVRERAPQARTGRPFFVYLALPAPHTPILPIEAFQGSSGLNPYGDFVRQVDHHMGELFAALEETGLDEDTLVLFTSDNGCSPEANFSLLREKGHDPSRGFRGHKADIYEGGHRVPCIVRWPAGVDGGRRTSALACVTDLYATLAAVTGQALSASEGEDSVDLLPVLRGERARAREHLVSHSISGCFAIRQGRWKLCLCAGSGGWSAPREGKACEGLPPMQLYDLDANPGERVNLVDAHPAKVDELLRLLADQVERGRSTPGEPRPNDREITFLPKGMAGPGADPDAP